MSALTKLDFMSYRKIAAVISIVLVIGSIASLATRQLSLGLDFTGGTLVEVYFENSPALGDVRSHLQTEFPGTIVQHFGSEHDILVRIPPLKEVSDEAMSASEGNKAHAVGEKAFGLIEANFGEVQLRRVEFVGPQVGDELRDQSGVAMLVALGFMLIYVTLRFTNKFALGAVAALFHDVILVLGCFSLFQLEFDLTVLAAVLAVIGYSLNDTIVVADRIRENFRQVREDDALAVINLSINQTLSRTIITSLTTVLVLVALFYFGGELIHNFAIALLVGVLIGTYSSIYVASNILVLMGIHRDDFLVVEAEEVDEMP